MVGEGEQKERAEGAVTTPPPPAPTATSSESTEDIKKILTENLRLTREIHKLVLSVRRYLLWQRVMSIVYLIILIAPIVLALIYLPPLLKPYLDQYSQLMNEITPGQSYLPTNGPIDLQKLLDQLRPTTPTKQIKP